MSLSAGPGERNVVKLDATAQGVLMTVTDSGGVRSGSPECKALLQTKALCWSRLGELPGLLSSDPLGPPFTEATLLLGDGDDETTANAEAQTRIDSSYQEGGAGNDILRGIGRGTIDPGPGNDFAYGGAKSDTFNDVGDGSGTDYYDGGGDLNWIYYLDTAQPLSVTLDGIANDGRAGERDNVVNVYAVVTGSGNDRIVGNDGTNYIQGGLGDDSIDGRGGNDYLDGSDGDDSVVGGAGNDQIELSARGFRHGGTDTVDAGSGDDQVNTFDESGDGPDAITCGPGNDKVFIDALDSAAADCESVTVLTR